MSWVPQAKDSPISITIGKIVEPYLSIFRRFIPQIAMIDFSPIVAIFALQLVEYGLLTVWVWFISFF
jgi:YggT family protein